MVTFKSVDFPLDIEFLGGVGFQFPLEGVNFLSVLFDEFSKLVEFAIVGLGRGCLVPEPVDFCLEPVDFLVVPGGILLDGQ